MASNPPTLTLSGTDASDFTLTLTDDNGNGRYELAFKAVSQLRDAPADAGKNNVYNITVTATDSDEPDGHVWPSLSPSPTWRKPGL